MQLRTKFGLVVLTFTVVSLGTLGVLFSSVSRQRIQDEVARTLVRLSAERAAYLESYLSQTAGTVRTIVTAPVLRDALSGSNAEWGDLNPQDRQDRLARLDADWQEAAADANLVRRHMTNPAARFLSMQQQAIPGHYGELFLTNRYGAVVATTAKLTTFAHAHKYWWAASYADGDGAVFFDDRGYDESVGGYVLGVVVPVFVQGSFAGILKANVNILSTLYEAIRPGTGDPVEFMIARSGGLVLARRGVQPLRTTVPGEISGRFAADDTGYGTAVLDTEEYFYAYAVVELTTDPDEETFGGSGRSIDHIFGNEGEAWVVVSLEPEAYAMEGHRRALQVASMVAAIIAVVSVVLVAVMVGVIVRPISDLSRHMHEVGDGDFSVSMSVDESSRELREITQAFNSMLETLRRTTVSRDKLLQEIEQRKKTEAELREALADIRTLSGLIPICAHCKRIRRDDGFWERVEEYVHQSTGAEFSHGVCPDCMEKHYGELFTDKKEKHEG